MIIAELGRNDSETEKRLPGEGASMVPASAAAAETLRSLHDIRPLYFLPNDPLAEEVLVPGFQNADRVDCMVGFFSSAVLASLAPGLATYISRSRSSFRLIISPLLRAEDQSALEEGIRPAEAVALGALEDLEITEDLIQQHTLKCLSYLLRTARMEIKIALMKDALFHPKVWLFQAADDVMAAHGSSNVTYAGIKKNIEQIAVSKSWEDANQRYITDKLQERFAALWDNKDDSCTIVSLPQAVKERLLKTYSSDLPPTEAELTSLYRRATGITQDDDQRLEPLGLARQRFAIPATLHYEDGPFAHQGRAVSAWCAAGFRGVLEMATGSGKTITAMICAHRVYTARKQVLIVIAAPYVPLILQWCDEVPTFGLRPTNLTLAAGARGRAHELNRLRRRMRTGASDVEAVIVSHKTLCDPSFHSELSKFECAKLLIADEAHNLGSEGFITSPPNFFEYRLGLSATPVRQYDDKGTDALFAYFGDVVFKFTLAQAIGLCLVEYDYFIHPVDLTPTEVDSWHELTDKIKATAWRQQGDDDSYLTKLLRDRHAVLETAQNKIGALRRQLEGEDSRKLRYTLIYASDKGPHQLDEVNALLKKRGVLFHQLTHQETADREETARIIKSFQAGELQVLTAKRVLDEGVNIPQICKAFILASTTVERQWVQRRGRLLRTCPEIKKTHSEIHDFVALPPNLSNLDDEARRIVTSELLRIQEFAGLARNAGRPGGPLELIHKLVQAAFM